MKINITIPDQEQMLVRALVQVEAKANQAVVDTINLGLLEIETRAKKFAPVDTGRLKASIHTVRVGKQDTFMSYTDRHGKVYQDGRLSVVETEKDKSAGFVGTNVEYAAEQEFGKSGRKGRYYLTHAVAFVREKLIAELKKINVE